MLVRDPSSAASPMHVGGARGNAPGRGRTAPGPGRHLTQRPKAPEAPGNADKAGDKAGDKEGAAVTDQPDIDLPEVHAQALAHTRGYVAGVKATQLGDPTPCDGWDVKTLLNHIISGNFWVRPLVEGKTIEEVGDQFEGDLVGDDPADAYNRSADDAAAAFRQAGAMESPVAVSYGPVPGSVYCGHRFIDVLIHGWDVAEATGQDTTLPPALVTACWEVVQPQAELLADSGAFGADHDVPDDADQQTKLLRLLGRHP
jgi:uncharacterized protein (TIGR03086 family)